MKRPLLVKILSIILVIGYLTIAGRPCYSGSIEIKTTEEGGYSFFLNGKPFLIRGINYNPVPIGKGYDYNFLTDKTKPWLTDGKLMKEAGINCVKIYSAGDDLKALRQFIRDMYKKFGIYTVVGDWLGLWGPTHINYADKKFRDETKQRILKKVNAFKKEKGLLMWILGNENNYTFSGRISFWTSPEIESIVSPAGKQIKKAEIYYSFIEEVTNEIKKIDKTHLIALGNGETNFLNVASGICKNIDVLSIIIYRGKKFGNLFNNIKNTFDKPLLLSEFGCDSYDAYKEVEDQEVQAEFLISQWKEIYENTTFAGNKNGSCLGGFVFEWNDEWWKHNEGYSNDWGIHNNEAGWSHGAYYKDIRAENNMNMNEEWFGIISLSEEFENGINKRVPKKAFYALKDFFGGLNLDYAKKIENRKRFSLFFPACLNQ